MKIIPAQVTTGNAPPPAAVDARVAGHSGARRIAEIFAAEPVSRPGARPPGAAPPVRERRPGSVEILLPGEAGDAPFIEEGTSARKRPAALTQPRAGTAAGAYVAAAELLHGPPGRGGILDTAA